VGIKEVPAGGTLVLPGVSSVFFLQFDRRMKKTDIAMKIMALFIGLNICDTKITDYFEIVDYYFGLVSKAEGSPKMKKSLLTKALDAIYR